MTRTLTTVKLAIVAWAVTGVWSGPVSAQPGTLRPSAAAHTAPLQSQRDSIGVNPCAAVRCRAGFHCESQEVQCVHAPCPPITQCVLDGPVTQCGGVAAFRCPGTGACEDDPRDDCDPKHNGSDCGGLCVCTAPRTCPTGQVFDSSAAVCDCVTERGRPTGCATDCECARGSICSKGQCEGAICTGEFGPVCGVNGKTYGNPCEARAAHAWIDRPGRCPGGLKDE